MTTAEKVPLDEPDSYALVTASYRAKVLAKRQPVPDEIVPVDGTLNVVLSGKPIPRGMEAAVFGESRIDIPEFQPEPK